MDAAYVPLEAVSYNEPVVYFCERADANQTQIYIYKEGSEWTPEKDILRRAFTRYFGEGFSALVLQEIANTVLSPTMPGLLSVDLSAKDKRLTSMAL